MDVATFGLDFLEECTTQGRTRSPSDGVPLFQGSFCSIIPWPIRWHEYDTLQMILGIFRHHGAHSCRLSGSNNLLMWLAQHGCLRTELNQFVANSQCHLDPVCEVFQLFFIIIQLKLSELLIFKVLNPKFRLKGAGFLENNLKKSKSPFEEHVTFKRK